MQCFSHTDLPARGLCKSCNRALCLQCLSEVGKSLACKNRCETDVAGLDEMLRKSVQLTNQPAYADMTALSRSASSLIASADIFNIIIGAIFLLYSAYEPSKFLAATGVAFAAFGLFGLIRRRLTLRKARPPSASPR